MRIEIKKKLGTVLSSRPAGKEALLAVRASLLRGVEKTEELELDFDGVDVLAPSWADEFVTPLSEEWGDKLRCVHTENPLRKSHAGVFEANVMIHTPPTWNETRYKKDIRHIIARTIPSERQVESFLFGSFVRERHFHDIDVGLLGATWHARLPRREKSLRKAVFPSKLT